MAISLAELEPDFEELKRSLAEAPERCSGIDEIVRGVFERLQRNGGYP